MTPQTQNTGIGFFNKYKKWFLALVIWQLIPVLLLIGSVGYVVISNYINSADYRSHPYKSFIISGFDSGFKDGEKEHVFGKQVPWSLWLLYDAETDRIKERALAEKDEYLAQFPKSERGTKRAEMKLNNIKLSLQLELEKRFSNGLDFYAHHVKQIVKRENFASDAEYQKALEEEAWKVGYAHGYREGKQGWNYRQARGSLR